METIGFVGLGTIGGVVAKNIQKAGYAMVVHDIRLAAVKPLVDVWRALSRRRRRKSRASAGSFSPRCRGRGRSKRVALGANGLVHGVRDGSIYVDLSSSSADLIRRIGAEFASRGARVMDAPLIVGKEGIAKRSVQVLASGAAGTFNEVKPLFDAFSDTVVYTGELGTGTVIKLAHNLVRRGIGLAIGEGLVLGAKAGVDPELLWRLHALGLGRPTQSDDKRLCRHGFHRQLRSAREFRHRPVAQGRWSRHRVGSPAQCADADRGVGRTDDDSRDQPRLVGAKHGVAVSPARGSGGDRGAQ